MATQPLHSIQDGELFDALVVGAGMVGASAALGLKQQGLKVVAIDSFAPSGSLLSYTPSYDARSTALSLGSRDILRQLGVWSTLSDYCCPIQQVHVSERGRLGTTRLIASEMHEDALGYVVSNQAIGLCVMDALASQSVACIAPAKVAAVETSQEGHRVEIASSGETLEILVKLLVIADGKDSSTARLLGIETEILPYDQRAMIATVSTSEANEGCAYERFTPDGPIALLPLGANTSALVWTRNEDSEPCLDELSDAAFLSALQQAFGDRLGAFTHCSQRFSYPLSLSRSREQVRHGVILLGNAAHSLHPVAGQGFNLALRGLAHLLESLKASIEAGEALGSLGCLKQCVEEFSQDQDLTILFSDQLIKVFGSDSPLLSVARDAGLIGLNALPMAKQAFARRAMGMGERRAVFSDGNQNDRKDC